VTIEKLHEIEGSAMEARAIMVKLLDMGGFAQMPVGEMLAAAIEKLTGNLSTAA
jgi:hypothetical protein